MLEGEGGWLGKGQDEARRGSKVSCFVSVIAIYDTNFPK